MPLALLLVLRLLELLRLLQLVPPCPLMLPLLLRMLQLLGLLQLVHECLLPLGGGAFARSMSISANGFGSAGEDKVNCLPLESKTTSPGNGAAVGQGQRALGAPTGAA